MERFFHYIIKETDQGRTIQEYLKKNGYSSQNIISLKKMPESVLLNGKWEYMTCPLKTGDRLTIHLQETEGSQKIPPVKLPLEILYEDEDLMVLNKPAGMPVHPSMNHHLNSLANGLAYYFESRKIPFVFRCINRLDKDTSGLTIVAKHMLSANILSRMIAQKSSAFSKDSSGKLPTICREYLAIIKGELSPSEGTIHAPIARRDASVIERIVDYDKGEDAITHYRTLQQNNGYSLLSLILETGRTHQIRVHLRHMGYPLVGDSLYNPDSPEMKRQALHSYRLSFPHPITGKELVFTAPLPEDMKDFFLIEKQPQ